DNVTGAPEGPMYSAKWASVRKEFFLMNPLLIARHVLDDPGAAKERGMTLIDGALHHAVEITLPKDFGGTPPLTLFVHAGTGTPTRASLRENDQLLRDVTVESFYSDFVLAGDVRTPRAVTLAVAGDVVASETRTDVETNAELASDAFSFPAGAKPTFVADDAR